MSEKSETKEKIGDMNKILRVLLLAILLCAWNFSVYGQEVTREQIKGLDEQVQEIKSDALSIAAELNQLEEKLLFPSQTQIALFVSLAEGEDFRLDSIEVQLDGKPLAHYLYSFKELEALRMGGVQRIYTGNIETGEHALLVKARGLTEGGSALELNGNAMVEKGVGPGVVEIILARQGITVNDR
jgi:hypothetical protein